MNAPSDPTLDRELTDTSDLRELVETFFGRDRSTANAVFETMSPHVAAIAQTPGATFRPLPEDVESYTRRAEQVIARLRHDTDQPLTLESELGRGGMGIVRLATQQTVGRRVAVKTLRRPESDPRAAMSLLQEG